MTGKKRLISCIIATIMLIGFCFPTLIACSAIKGLNEETGDEDNVGDGYLTEVFDSGVYNPTKVGYSAEYLGTVPRRIPELSDGGLERYPQYDVTLRDTTDEEKQKILDENSAIIAKSNSTDDKGNHISGTYDSMDADGNLYLDGKPINKKLYKHTASIGMYKGDVSDDEQAVIKRITMQSRPSGNHLTGLYAPAGEVIKIEMTKADLERTGGLTFYIGQVLQNGQPNNIWKAREFNRMPVIVNSLTVKDELSYIGSYLGGPIYVRPVNAGVKFSVTISGGVPYSHYIHGYTTEAEFEEYRDSSAPYFDLEVWDDAVRHSGPKAMAAQFDYNELVDAAILWDKISRVSNQVPSGSRSDIGITFLYDPFIAAGSMVAFVGRSTVNCPLYCMTAALDADSAVNNSTDAFWGCIHEYNHHFQKFGFGPGDEVTNNAVSLVAYSLYTRNSSNRELGVSGEGHYAVGWDNYTNPSWTLKQTLANTGPNAKLDSYANLLHSFGQNRFIAATQNGKGSGGADTWYKAVSDAVQYDMRYYFTEILHQTVSKSVLDEYAAKKYPMYVPVATIYQTGVSYTVDGQKYYSRTAQPYGIETGNAFEINLRDNLVIPNGFSWQIKDISQPQYGTLTKKSDKVYIYNPDSVNRESGKIRVTLEITKNDRAFEVEDVDIVIELRQKQANPNMLERTVYTYTADTMYTSPVDAYEKGYAGYQSAVVEDNENPVKNSNTDLWVPNPTENAVIEIRGKFYVSNSGKYRLAIRGRKYAALYVSLDNGENYELAANMVNEGSGANFNLNNQNNYKDYYLEKGQWIYFKEVLLVTYKDSFVGMGIGQFNGDNVNVSYLNAYRATYVKEPFETDYYYAKDYEYDYKEVSGSQSVVSTNYKPWDSTMPIDNLFDDVETNYIHSDRSNISPESPFELTVDLGREMRANEFTIYGEQSRQYQPKDFKLYGGTDLENMELLVDIKDSVRVNHNITVNFDERNMRYYKLVVTDTWAIGQNYRYIAFRTAKVSYYTGKGQWLSPDESMFEYRGNWNLGNKLSTFGHLYEGENATLEFEFTGSRFAIFSYVGHDYDSFEVIIDGKVSDIVNIRGNAENTQQVYLSEKLTAGKHKVTIRSKTRYNIDSVAVWK